MLAELFSGPSFIKLQLFAKKEDSDLIDLIEEKGGCAQKKKKIFSLNQMIVICGCNRYLGII